MKFRKSILKKFNKPGPRYTSYPPATHFDENFSINNYITQVENSNFEEPSNISLYFHVPFCPQICHFCGCTTETGFTKPFIQRYVDAVISEVKNLSKYIDKSRLLTQIHWGGGTPNAISLSFIEQITNVVKDIFILSKDYEMAIECSPAHLDFSHIEHLKKIGFNRISLGVQDFDNKILDAINRRRPKHPIKDIVEKIKSEGFVGTNIDLIYGLPLQTPKSFQSCIETAIEVNPDRIVTFSYAHVPSVIPRQKILEKFDLPDSNQKAQMYDTSFRLLTKAGYNAIGMDHFAKPDDEFSIALNQKKLHRNFQGYCTRLSTGQVYGFGASSISQLDSCYSQNTKNASKYIYDIKKYGLATFRGYVLTKQEKIIRDVINSLMCNYYLSFDEIALKYNTDVKKVKDIIKYSTDEFKDFLSLKLMKISNNKIEVFDEGRLVIRNIAMKFDPLMKTKIGTYSKTI